MKRKGCKKGCQILVIIIVAIVVAYQIFIHTDFYHKHLDYKEYYRFGGFLLNLNNVDNYDEICDTIIPLISPIDTLHKRNNYFVIRFLYLKKYYSEQYNGWLRASTGLTPKGRYGSKEKIDSISVYLSHRKEKRLNNRLYKDNKLNNYKLITTRYKTNIYYVLFRNIVIILG